MKQTITIIALLFLGTVCKAQIKTGDVIDGAKTLVELVNIFKKKPNPSKGGEIKTSGSTNAEDSCDEKQLADLCFKNSAAKPITISTKIKGKVKLYKKKKNDNYKRDRKNKVGVSWCAREWDNCDGSEWSADLLPYKHPRQEGRGKVAGKKSIYKHPTALKIEMSYHFLQFKFGYKGILVDAKNLLGTNGCASSSNTDW